MFMGKQQKGKKLTILPKAATPVTFLLSPPVSPRATIGKGFSSPIVSLVPKEARRKARTGSFDAREPTSPKVSCLGQIKNMKKKTKMTKPQETSLVLSEVMMKIFKVKQQGGKSDNDTPDERSPVANGVPSLGHVKQFARGRCVLHNFDWKARDAEVVPDRQNYYPQGDNDEGKENMIAARCEPIAAYRKIAVEPRKDRGSKFEEVSNHGPS